MKRLFLVCLMACSLLSLRAATVTELDTIKGDWTFIADDITSNGTVGLTANTLYADNRIFTPTGNSKASNKGSNTFGGGSHLNSLRVKNVQDRLAFCVGDSCTITFYSQSQSSRGIVISTADRTSVDDPYLAQQPASTPKWEVKLPAAGTYYLSSYGGDFYFAGMVFEFAAAPAAPAVSIPAAVETTTGTETRLHADIVATPAVTGIQWYQNTTASNEGGTLLDGATTENLLVTQEAVGTYYYYVTVTNAIGTTASNVCTLTVAGKASFRDFSVQVNNQEGTLLTAGEQVRGSAFSFGVAVDAEGIVSRVATNSPAAVATVSGSYHSDHGSNNLTVVTEVPGNVRITVANCTFGNNHTTVVKNANGETVASATGEANCWKNGHSSVNVLYYAGDAEILTITCPDYCAYVKVEQVETVPTQHTVNIYNGETLVETKLVYDGTTLGALPAAPTVEAGLRFRGWYTATDGTGIKALPGTTVSADMNLYAFIMAIPALEDGAYQVAPVGSVRMNGETLLNALEYCGAQAGTTVQKIAIANGTYDLGTACRTELKQNIVLLGESREGVLVVNHPTAPGIQATSTFRITGENVYIQKMTLRCDISYSTSSTHGVGVALEINGNKSICYDVDLQCNQDTYYSNVNDAYVGYFKSGRIEGTVDFICGGGNMWFEQTTLYCNQRYDSNSGQHTNGGDCIGAPATGVNSQYGYVFNGCTIDGADCQEGAYNLARGWQNSPAMTWINTTCLKTPSTQGYTNMGSGLVCRFHEFNTMAADGETELDHTHSLTAPRALGYSAESDAIYLTAEQAAAYTKANVFGEWDPDAIIASYNPEPVGPTTGIKVDNAQCTMQSAKLLRNGRVVIIRDGVTYDVIGRRLE